MIKDIIYLEWIDCEQYLEPWINIKDVGMEPALIRSVGYLIKETETYIIIAACIDNDTYEHGPDHKDAYFSRVMKIPKCQIKLKTILAYNLNKITGVSC